MSLHNQGFNTWIGKVQELSRNINIDIDNADPGTFKELCKKILKDNFIEKWNASLNNGASSILRTHATFKQTFQMDFYSENVNQFRYRNAITKLRVSSHVLEIERGRHCGLSVEERVCGCCHCIEDEKHFLFDCSIVKEARLLLNTRICSKYSHYTNLNDEQKMFFLFTSRDPQLLSWIGKFIYFALRQRDYYHASLLDNRCSGAKRKMKWFLQVLKFIRHSQNWDLSHNIIIIVLLECHHTKTIACHLFAEISRKKWSILYVARQQMCFELSLFLYTYLYGCISYVLHIILF